MLISPKGKRKMISYSGQNKSIQSKIDSQKIKLLIKGLKIDDTEHLSHFWFFFAIAITVLILFMFSSIYPKRKI